MKSLVKAIKKAYKIKCKLSSLLQLMIVKLTLLMTAIWAIISIIVNQIPIFSALSATALLVSQTNFWASSLISTQLFRRAKSGASGKAATKIVINPNWRTEKKNNIMKILNRKLRFMFSYSFLNILGTIHHFQQVCSLLPFERLQCYSN